LKIENCKLKIFIAYEPVWAISTNLNAEADTPENTLQTIDFIKSKLILLDSSLVGRIKFLYGGSINSNNAEKFIQHQKIDGALVGGASLKPEEVRKIIEVALKY
jgi:triosephosphate isomerase